MAPLPVGIVGCTFISSGMRDFFRITNLCFHPLPRTVNSSHSPALRKEALSSAAFSYEKAIFTGKRHTVFAIRFGVR